MAAPRIVETGPDRPPLVLAGREAALVVLSGVLGSDLSAIGPGEAVVGPSADLSLLAAGGAARLLLEERDEPGGAECRSFGGRRLDGASVAGISGLRVLHRSPGGVLLRFGPPPGARWLVTGLRSFAVFTGRFLLFEDAAPRPVGAGEWLISAEPSRTLPLQAGNDSALALALAAPDVRVALG